MLLPMQKYSKHACCLHYLSLNESGIENEPPYVHAVYIH